MEGKQEMQFAIRTGEPVSSSRSLVGILDAKNQACLNGLMRQIEKLHPTEEQMGKIVPLVHAFLTINQVVGAHLADEILKYDFDANDYVFGEDGALVTEDCFDIE